MSKIGSLSTVVLLTVCFLFIAIKQAQNANILAIITVPSYSHQIPYRPLWTTLSKRGHKVVVLTTDPMNDPSLTNLTEIDFHINYRFMRQINFVKRRFTDTWLDISKMTLPSCNDIAISIYEHPEVRKMYEPNSGWKFDVVFMEIIKTPGIYALAHRFNAPIIGVSSLGLYTFNQYLFGGPVLPSHPSNWEMENRAGFNLSLFQRIKNFVIMWHYVYFILNDYMSEQQKIAEKYLGKNIPNIADIERNISVVFCNQQEAISFIRPRTPNIMPFGSFHVSKESNPLSEDLKEFLDNSPNGFVYVSLGTNVAVSSFPQYIQDIFYDVFANLPCNILWKSDIILPNKSDNIFIASWLPQQSILAHPKLRLFVYQGGVQSTEEAVHYMVPLVGIPMLGDQDSQVFKMVSLGVAEYVNILEMSREALNTAIMKVLNDNGYKERIIKVKALNEDKPYDLLKNAVWWTEFVIRHKGAPHLLTSIAHEPWYQKYDMDIIAVLSITIFVISFCILIMMCKLLMFMINYNMRVLIDSNKKIS